MSLVVEQLRVAVGNFSAGIERLEIAPGEIACLMGKSGSGKTTLLHAIAGFLPASGMIRVSERRLDGLPPEKRGMALVFQRAALFPHLTVSGNVEFALKVQGVKVSERRKRAGEWLERLGVRALADRAIHGLSGGEAQRVALGRALIAGFPVLLLDEPFSAVDAETREELRRVLRQLVTETKVAALLVTHDEGDAEIGDSRYGLSHGELHRL